MDSREIARRRIHNLLLAEPSGQSPEAVVRWLGAVQSQEYAPAKWSLGQRARGVDDAAVEGAFAEGRVLRTHVLRPTWHFVAPEDVRWLLDLTAPRVQASNASRYRQLGLDSVTLDRSLAVLHDALAGGQQRTRDEVRAALEEAGIATEGQRLAHTLLNAEMTGLIGSGAPRGKQHTYTLLEERAPAGKSLDRDEALAELTRRYFASHGPATAKDFQWWSSLTLADIKRGLAMVGSTLEQVTLDGLKLWHVPSPPPPEPRSPTVHLLQTFDEYVVGYQQSRHLFDIAGVAPGWFAEPTTFSHVLLLDSQVAGRWKRTVKKGAVLVDVVLYRAFDDEQTRALHHAVERFGRFLGLPATASVEVS